MAGRYEDALRVLEEQSTDNYIMFSWVYRGVSNAALGKEEAKATVAKTLIDTSIVRVHQHGACIAGNK